MQRLRLFAGHIPVHRFRLLFAYYLSSRLNKLRKISPYSVDKFRLAFRFPKDSAVAVNTVHFGTALTYVEHGGGVD
jgi:hypothetical protein